jgi:hypothetical protein
MASHFSGPVVSTNGFQGAVTGAVTGDVAGNVVGNVTGLHYDPVAPVAYSAADAAGKAILPSIAVAKLTKTTPAAIDYTLAAPGAANVNKFITVYTVEALAHVVTVTGCLGGTTMTFAAAAGASFTLYAISATAWAVVALNGVTQS